ncbi:archaemetzincin family Zn-dependent metalloprotease [Candidatus Bathyarchaeota archaeon]|nr:archaemetzincin family Zn-dependent metalloprotease [Candidatus Bathyarchaeota archaeon]
MEIGILRIGQVDFNVLNRICENLNMAFPKTRCQIISETLALPQEALDKVRGQYRSDVILSLVAGYAEKAKNMNRVLGVVDVDIYVLGLNFVFGEAECPGKAALISLWRLRPEFYGAPSNFELFIERGTKEAVHELGHTFGLTHCRNPFCVMYFSNSIFETDRKKGIFCSACYPRIQKLL